MNKKILVNVNDVYNSYRPIEISSSGYLLKPEKNQYSLSYKLNICEKQRQLLLGCNLINLKCLIVVMVC